MSTEPSFDASERGDYATALKEYRPLAVRGDLAAQNNLGVMYGKGEGVIQYNVQAHKWANLAAARLHGEERDKSVKNRDLAASKMTPADISRAQRLAREWTSDKRCP